MSNNKNKKRVYSKPVVEQPKEEAIEEQVDEVTEAKPVDPEVFETKLFVEEQPEEFIEISGEEELVEEPEIVPEELTVYHSIDAEAEMTKMLQAEMGGESQGVDAVEEFRKMVQAELEKPLTDEELTKESPAPEPEKITEEFVKGDELTEKLEEIKTKIEEFQTIQVVPAAPEPEPMYTLTPEQEEEGAKAIAEMVEQQILQELREKALPAEPKIHGEYFLTEKQAHEVVKALSPEPEKDKELKTLSQHDLRHFHRTGQLPK
jgi:hypothetical protein